VGLGFAFAGNRGGAVASDASICVDGFWYARYVRFAGCSFEFLAGMKGHDAARWNVHLDASFWVAAWSGDPVAELKVADAWGGRIIRFQKLFHYCLAGRGGGPVPNRATYINKFGLK
jgi:hypothetical protein